MQSRTGSSRWLQPCDITKKCVFHIYLISSNSHHCVAVHINALLQARVIISLESMYRYIFDNVAIVCTNVDNVDILKPHRVALLYSHRLAFFIPLTPAASFLFFAFRLSAPRSLLPPLELTTGLPRYVPRKGVIHLTQDTSTQLTCKLAEGAIPFSSSSDSSSTPSCSPFEPDSGAAT